MKLPTCSHRQLLRLALPDAGTVCLSIQAGDAAVAVERDRFLEAWRRSPQPFERELAGASPAAWRQDRKFVDADSGFSRSMRNPIPLADVVATSSRGVAFVDGITRTLWLLAHGTLIVPVRTSDDRTAAALDDIAGADAALVARLVEVSDA